MIRGPSHFALVGAAVLVGTLSGVRAWPEVPASADALTVARDDPARMRAPVRSGLPSGIVIEFERSAAAAAGAAAPPVMPAVSAAPTMPGLLPGDFDQAVLPLREHRPRPTSEPEAPAQAGSPTATPPWAIPMHDSVADMARRPVPARDPRNASTRFDPASLPGSLLGVGFAGPNLTADELLTGTPTVPGDTSGPTAWSVEVAYTSDHRFDEVVVAELLAKQERGFRVILRVDYERKQPVPPVADPEAVQRYVDTFLRLYDQTGGTVRYFIVGNEGNVDSAGDDPSRVTECLAGRAACAPESYVQVYRRVRAAMRSRTNAYVLVGAPSPGGPRDDPMRYADGASYLTGILALLHPLEVDGVALHSYGGPAFHASPATSSSLGLDEFTADLDKQIRAVAESGLVSTPIFLTEMNQRGAPHPDFVRGALGWIDEHNRRSAQDIVAANWFVYHDEMDQWREYALEGRPAILDALREAAELAPGR